MDRNLLEDITTRRLIASIPEPVRNNIDKFIETTIESLIDGSWETKDKGTE
jgi:hypothetical protein